MIEGVGLCCALGDTWTDAVAGYCSGLNAIIRDRDVIRPDGFPQGLAPVIAFGDERDPALRLASLLGASLTQLAGPTGADIAASTDVELFGPQWAGGERASAALARAARERGFGRLTHRSQDNETFAGVLAEAISRVGSGEQDALVVGAVDTFLHADLLDALSAQGRLLERTRPHGVIPGEAAAAFLVRAPDGPDKKARSEALGTVRLVARGWETEDVAAPATVIGRGLAKVLRRALEEASPDRLMADLNGERWRAEEIGFALGAAPPLPHDLEGDFETPLMQTGFCGAADGAVLTALALAPPPTAYARRMAGDAEATLILSSQRNGHRSATLVERFAR